MVEPDKPERRLTFGHGEEYVRALPFTFAGTHWRAVLIDCDNTDSVEGDGEGDAL